MKTVKSIYLFLLGVLFLSSCAAPTYLAPDIKYLVNKASFSVQNMDQKGKIEPQSLTTHYDGFDVRYKIDNTFVVSLEIVNTTNKSLIIDKSKSYVLYNGYSRDLFKDVRSSRSTTFNNVQDAINNVQTSDASVIMSIPPYSKWELPLGESNVKNIEKFPDFIQQPGTYPIQSYDNPEPVEFVIPYTFDYALGKWDTSRNRVYVSQIKVENQDARVSKTPSLYSVNSYKFGKVILPKNEVDKINEINIKTWKSHRHKVNARHIVLGIITIPTISIPFIMGAQNEKCNNEHRPYIYNSDGTTCGVYNKKRNYKAKY
ncbi:MAG: hypothetical protein K2O17_06105 [Bacteroidaceae bacterium]|nr:hypothetical protein [Bacteroidaceae bacterium]